jgi:hypothetical protein
MNIFIDLENQLGPVRIMKTKNSMIKEDRNMFHYAITTQQKKFKCFFTISKKLGDK